jgi:hypothetical protein
MSFGTPSVTGPSSSRPGNDAWADDDPVIELGDREPAVESAPPPQLTGSAQGALIVLLSLITLTAAAPRAPAMTEVGTLGGRNVTAVALQPGTAVVATADPGAGTTTVQRYALDDGRTEPGWSTPVPYGVDDLTVRDGAATGTNGGSTVVAFSYAGAGLTVLDGDTGTMLWTMANANVLQMFDDAVLLLPRSSDGADGTRLRMVSLRTGATRWTRDDEISTWQFDNSSTLGPPPRSLVTIGQDGRVATYDLADSRLVAGADLGFRLTHEELHYQRDFTTATVVDRVLYVARRTGGRTSLAAYPIDTLRKAWETTGGPVGGLNDCRPHLCIGDETSVSVLDPADGRVLWTDTRWSFVFSSAPVDGTRLIASTKDPLPESVLLDAATGRALHHLGPGTLLDGSRTLFLRAEGIGSRAQVTTVEPVSGALQVLGEIGPVTPHRCRSTGDYLTCPTVGGPTRVWHLPPR